MGSGKLCLAVMDGCTTAIESHFASTLVGKVLRKIGQTRIYKEYHQIVASSASLDETLQTIVTELFQELNVIKNQLMLDKKELLTTLILLLYDQSNDEGIVLIVGDGMVSINGEVTVFDQDNKPDYLGFHLHEDPVTWYKAQTQKLSFKALKDVSIATDGMETFTKIKEPATNESIVPLQYLLQDRQDLGNNDMLHLKLKRLEHVYGVKPTDDIAIIRICKF